MNIKTNVSFSELTTMRIGGPARFFAAATTTDELVALYRNAKRLDQKVFIIGGGSNLIVRDAGFDGLVVHNQIPGFDVVEDNADFTVIRIGSGELWDSIVAKTVDMGLTGIEALSAIPGTAGAAPVQNIGAYGQEVADTLTSVEAYDTHTDSVVRLSWEDCEFSYRHSIFRGSEQNRYAIVAITLKLYKTTPVQPFYAAVQDYLDARGITDFTPAVIRAAVIDIRTNKLPDPAQLPNSGSFFKNAIVEKWQADNLRRTYPEMPAYEMDGGHYKIPTGWLIETAELKGMLINGFRVHTGNALVLINESATGYADLATAREHIINTVRDKFQVIIEQEPLEI